MLKKGGAKKVLKGSKFTVRIMMYGVINYDVWCDSRGVSGKIRKKSRFLHGRRFFGAYGADIGRTELVFAPIESPQSQLSIRAKTSSARPISAP